MPFASLAFTEVAPGTLSVGGVVSTTLTANVAVAVFPAASAALQVTVV
jgi:hypothetical protein